MLTVVNDHTHHEVRESSLVSSRIYAQATAEASGLDSNMHTDVTSVVSVFSGSCIWPRDFTQSTTVGSAPLRGVRACLHIVASLSRPPEY